MVVDNFIESNHSIKMVSGPTKSGKSRWAEHLLTDNRDVICIATGPLLENDQSWQERIEAHRDQRPNHWSTIECEGDLCMAMSSISTYVPVLIDSLGGVVARYLDDTNEEWSTHQDQVIKALVHHQAEVVVVVEETGWGVVPSTTIGGLFRERLGILSQKVSNLANECWLVMQGRAINIMEWGVHVP